MISGNADIDQERLETPGRLRLVSVVAAEYLVLLVLPATGRTRPAGVADDNKKTTGRTSSVPNKLGERRPRE
jgi:hypothetical protein